MVIFIFIFIFILLLCWPIVTGVAEATVSGLGGALVEAHLQVELTLVGAQLLLGEGALVLVGHLGAQGGAGELGVLLRLQGKPQLLGRLSQKNFLVREMDIQICKTFN